MKPTVCVFEDERHGQFLPIAYTRPVYDLMCGMRALSDKIASAYPGCDIRHLCRPHLLRTAGRGMRQPLVGGEMARVSRKRCSSLTAACWPETR